jgi:DUF4097 and DUF4098 domain-containing protein YvlB
MRRGSIVGPVLLIGLGVLFLANNLRPDLNFFELVAQYWPFLLIAWGVLRLIEIAFLAIAKKTVPDRGLGGGEWVLVVFICLIGSGMFLFHHHIGWNPVRLRLQGIEMFGEAFDYNISEQKVACGKTPHVVIENFRGNSRIVGGDLDEIKVSGRKTVRAMRSEDATSADQRTQLEVVRQGDVITVRTNTDRSDTRMRVHADIDITVPKGASIEARGRYGDFDVSDITGALDVQSDNAALRAQNLGGNLKADIRRSDVIRATNVKGGVELRVTGQSDNLELENIEGPVTLNGSYFEVDLRHLAQAVRFDGPQTDFRAERCDGQIHMTPTSFNADNIIGPVTLTNSRSKDVQITDATESLQVALDRGDIELRSSKLPLPKMDLRTRNGSVTLALPENAKFALKASTRRGEVHNEYGGPVQVEEGHNSGSLTASTGGPEVVAATDRGDVTVRKATGEVMAHPSVEWPRELPKPPKPPRIPKVSL